MSENKKMCFCEGWGLEADDTLYVVSSDDASIVYTPIYSIKFCPLCGNKLPTVATHEIEEIKDKEDGEHGKGFT